MTARDGAKTNAWCCALGRTGLLIIDVTREEHNGSTVEHWGSLQSGTLASLTASTNRRLGHRGSNLCGV